MFQGESCRPVVEQHHEIDVASATAGNDVNVYATSEADLKGAQELLLEVQTISNPLLPLCPCVCSWNVGFW